MCSLFVFELHLNEIIVCVAVFGSFSLNVCSWDTSVLLNIVFLFIEIWGTGMNIIVHAIGIYGTYIGIYDTLSRHGVA